MSWTPADEAAGHDDSRQLVARLLDTADPSSDAGD